MARSRVTVAISEDAAAQAKRLAQSAGIPVSRWVAKMVESGIRDQAQREKDRRDASFRRIRARLKKGYNLGTGGRASWTRDELHER